MCTPTGFAHALRLSLRGRRTHFTRIKINVCRLTDNNFAHIHFSLCTYCIALVTAYSYLNECRYFHCSINLGKTIKQ